MQNQKHLRLLSTSMKKVSILPQYSKKYIEDLDVTSEGSFIKNNLRLVAHSYNDKVRCN